MMHPISIELPPWLRIRGTLETPDPQQPDPQRPDPLTLLRQEFQDALAAERTERQALVTKLDEVRKAATETECNLTRTQKELDLSRDYGKQQAKTIALMESTIKSLQASSERATAEYIALTGSNGALQEALRRLEADHKIDQETIALLRERLHTMEQEMARLRDTNQQHVGTIAGLRLAVADLQGRLDLAYTRLRDANLSVEGLT